MADSPPDPHSRFPRCPEYPPFSVPWKRQIQCFKQSRVTERFVQKFHGSLFERSRADSLVLPGGNKDDRDLLPPPRQFLLKIKSSHSWHHDIEDQTPRFIDTIGCQKGLR